MARGEEVELLFGEGRISGVLGVLLGASSLIAALCFHFPDYLTPPGLRAVYPVDWLRWLLLSGMPLAVVFGEISLFLSSSNRLGFTGIALALAAQWSGGANVYIDDFEQPAISFGFDWLVLALVDSQRL